MHKYTFLEAPELHLKTCREIKLVAEAADRRKYGMELKRRKKEKVDAYFQSAIVIQH